MTKLGLRRFLGAALGSLALLAAGVRAAPPGLTVEELGQLEESIQTLLERHPAGDPSHGRVADGLLMAAALRVLGGDVPAALPLVNGLLVDQKGMADPLSQQKSYTVLAWLNELAGKGGPAARARAEADKQGEPDPAELDRLLAMLAAVDRHKRTGSSVSAPAPAWGRRGADAEVLGQLKAELEGAKVSIAAVKAINDESKGLVRPGYPVAEERAFEARAIAGLQDLQARRAKLAQTSARAGGATAADIKPLLAAMDELSGLCTTRLLMLRLELAAVTGQAPQGGVATRPRVQVPGWRTEDGRDRERGRGRGFGRDRDRDRDEDRGRGRGRWGRGDRDGRRGGRGRSDRVEDVFDEETLRSIEKAFRELMDQEDPSFEQGQLELADGVLGLAAIYSILGLHDRGLELAKALEKKLAARPAGLGKPVQGLLKIRMYSSFARTLARRDSAAEADFREAVALGLELPQALVVGYPVTARLYMQYLNTMDDLRNGARFEALAQTIAYRKVVAPVPHPVPADARPITVAELAERGQRLEAITPVMEEVKAWMDRADSLTAAGRPGLTPRAQYDQGVVDRQKKLTAERRWVHAFLGELEVSDDPAVAEFRADQGRELESLAELVQELGRLFLARAFMVRVDIAGK